MADMTTKILTVDLQADKAINGIIRLNNALDANNRQIALNNDAIAENNKAMKEQGADTMALTQQNEQLRKANVELGAQQKALKDERRLLQRETQNEIKAQAAEQGSLRALSAELSKLKSQWKGYSAEQRAANQSDLKRIQSLDKEVKGLEAEIGQFQRNVGNYEGAINNAVFGNNKFAASLMAMNRAAGGGFVATLRTMGQATVAFGKTLLGLMANPVFAILAGIASAAMAFKGLFEYNKAIAEATRLTREFLGVTGDELVAVRSEIQAIADTYDKDYKQVLETVDTLTSQYGMTAQEAMRTIRDGFQAGADEGGKMLDNIKQYAPAFNDAGLSADKMVAIMAQTRSGIFSEQGLDLISKANQRIRRMSSDTRAALQAVGLDANKIVQQLNAGEIDTFDVIQQVSAKLAELPPQSQAVGEALQGVFGRSAAEGGTKMVAELANIATGIEEVKKQTGEWGELNDEMVDKNQEINTLFASMFDLTQKGFAEGLKRAGLFVKQGLIQIVKWVIEAYNWFADWYNESMVLRSAIAGIGVSFRVIWAVIKAVIQGIIAGVKSTVTVFQGLGEVIKGIFTFSWETMKAGIDKIRSGVVQGFRDNLAAVKDAGKDIGNAFSDGIQQTIHARLKKGSFATIANHVVGGGEAAGGGVGGGGTGGSRGGGGSTGGGGGSTGASTAEEEAEALAKRLDALAKKGDELYRKSLEAKLAEDTSYIHALFNIEKEAFLEQYGAREQYLNDEEALYGYDKALADIEARRAKSLTEFYANIKKKEAEQAERVKKEGKALAEAILAGTKEGSAEQMEWRLNILKLQEQAELAELEANEEAKTQRKEWWEAMRTAIVEKYRKQQTEIEQTYADKQKEIEISKLQAAGQVVGAMSQLVEGVADENKEMLAAQKFLALGEIMISQAVAIANAVKAGSNAVTPWQLIAQIASSITAVTVAMAQAFKSLDKAKFATGGYIRGAGTSTSDSIPIRVSNGESIMNANTTAMFGGLLSSLNQLGGGAPIQVQQTAATVNGEDMLARAFARGVAMLPAPVVSVEDINRGQRQVAVMNDRATL